MASTTRQVTVSSAHIALDGSAATAAGATRTLAVTASADIYVGYINSTLTTTGYKLTAGNTLTVQLNPGERLYGVRVSGDATAYVISSDWALA